MERLRFTFVFMVSFTAYYAQGQEMQKKEFLPDLTNLFSELSSNSNQDDYLAIANDLYTKNRDLRASELYLYSSLMYCKAGREDSAGIAMLSAFASGMANANILGKDENLKIIKESEHWPAIQNKLDSLRQKLNDPSNFEVNTESLESFFQVHNTILADSERSCAPFENYILSGSEAIRDFYVTRYKNVDRMCEVMVEKESQHYTYLQSYYQEGNFEGIRAQCEGMMTKFAEQYAEAVFPKVYIVPGILNMGGGVSNLGLYVGGEKYIKSAEMPPLNGTQYDSDEVATTEAMAYVTFHELMHFQQNYADETHRDTVLGKVIQEGVCDFLVQLFSEADISTVQYDYLSEPERMKAVLAKLREEQNSKDLSSWMYNSETEDWPSDMGYMIGAEICRSYYVQSHDKKEALHELLNTDDFTDIYENSAYSDLLNHNK